MYIHVHVYTCTIPGGSSGGVSSVGVYMCTHVHTPGGLLPGVSALTDFGNAAGPSWQPTPHIHVAGTCTMYIATYTCKYMCMTS